MSQEFALIRVFTLWLHFAYSKLRQDPHRYCASRSRLLEGATAAAADAAASVVVGMIATQLQYYFDFGILSALRIMRLATTAVYLPAGRGSGV
jgi:hypothetical protein